MFFSLLVGLAACGESEVDNKGTASNNGDPNNGVATNNGNPNNGSNNGSNNGTGATVVARTSALNYYSDIKPIIDAKCLGCHISGGIAPFTLNTYEEVYSIRALIASNVKAGTMPPFLPGPDCRDYQFDPTLTPTQKDTIEEWANADAKEGDSAKAGQPLNAEPYTPPILDTVIEMKESYTPLLSPDDYRCFVIDWPHDGEKFITGFGVTPGSPTIVHHMIAFLAGPDKAQQALDLDAAEAGPGYTCFGDSGLGDGAWLGSWAPGGVDSSFPEGTGSKILPGSKIILQIHYNTLEATPIPDLSQVKFRTADSVEKEGFFLPWANPGWIGSQTMKIQAGNADAKHKFSFDPTLISQGISKLTIYSGGMHMHLLGKSSKTWIQRANGDQECLIDIPKWDFNWQAGVAFSEPAILNPGDELSLECHWDNSMENQPVIDGKRATPKDVVWGEGTRDEMCLGVFFVTAE